MFDLTQSEWLLLSVAFVVCGVAGGLLLHAHNTGVERDTFRRRGAGQFADGPQARVVKRSESLGLGCFVQLIGVALMGGGIFSLSIMLGLIGLAVVMIGGRQARWLQCSACSGRIAEETAVICPHCRSRLTS